ncbi:MAG: pilus assembly protein N-terminal domain-containing protein [Planctomycetales bacterium]
MGSSDFFVPKQGVRGRSRGRIRRLGQLASCGLAVLATSACFAQEARPGGVPQLPATQPRTVSPELKQRVNSVLDSIESAEVGLEVPVQRSKLMRFKQEVTRIAVADPSVIETVPFGPDAINVIGSSLGTTTLTLWFGNGAPGREGQILSVQVTVVPNAAEEDRRRVVFGAMQRMINELFPNSKIQLIPIADKLIVRGQARDEEEAVQIMSVLQARANQAGGAAGPLAGPLGLRPFGPFGYDPVTGAVAPYGGYGPTFAGGAPAAPLLDADVLPQGNIINMLEVPGPKQVMLKVRIAELQRSAVRRLGVDFDLDIGDFLFSSSLVGSGNILASGTFDGDSFNLALDALSGYGVAKILAEPNLVTLSGQTATFISGGQFPVPTVVGVGGVGAAGTSFKGFGTQLTFTPTVLDRDRIRLQVAPTFSTINSSVAVSGIPGLNTRGAVTTVDLREGQVLAIAGLIQEQSRGDSNWVPGIGTLPIANLLFSSRAYSRDETELVILVSPELVHPIEPGNAPMLLPGMEVTEPDDLEFFIHGHLEGPECCHHRSTVWPMYRDRMCAGPLYQRSYQASESYYIQGSHGFSE